MTNGYRRRGLALAALFMAPLLWLSPAPAWSTLQVFACEPEWAALAEEIGAQHVSVFSATTAKQDPHYIRARPSLLAQARRADLFFCTGAALEVGWLPLLLQRASADVQPGTNGYLMAADQLSLLGQGKSYDRSQGDIHPEGNPHVHLNPHNLLPVAQALTERLVQLDAKHAATYRQNFQAFAASWKTSIEAWEARGEALSGMSVVVHHSSFDYLLSWLGINQVATLEEKPGIAPSIAHLEKVLQQVKKQPVTALLRTPFDPADASRFVAQKTATPTLVLPFTVGGDDRSQSLHSLFEQILTLLLQVKEQADQP